MRAPLLVVAAAIACTHRGATPPPSIAEQGRAPITVALVVDQFAAWVAEERLPLLPASGGFARLRREGTWLRDVRYAHAATDTAPGHAALFTGRPPRETGIVANEIVVDGRSAGVLWDGATNLISSEGAEEVVGSSPARLRVDTIADRLRAEKPRSQIVAISIKDRAAIFGGGREPDATLWFEPKLDRFVTSTAFARELPPWALPFATTSSLVARRQEPWTPLDPAFVARHAGPDDQPGEGDWRGLGRTFPHSLAGNPAAPIAMRATPFADDAVLSLAIAAIEARDPKRPLFLALSLSANDYVAHVFGPDSWEAWDLLLRLDRGLGVLFSRLDAAVSPQGWRAILGADHGGPPLPSRPRGCDDRWRRPCKPGSGAIFPRAVEDALEEAIVARVGASPSGRWIEGVADPFVYLGPSARSLPAERLRLVEEAVVDRIRSGLFGLVAAYPTRLLPTSCPPESDESEAALVCRSVDPRARGEIFVVPGPGAFFDTGYAVGEGQNHGTPWLFDRSVPILARAPGRIAEGRVVEAPESFATYARTLAGLLDLPALEGTSGRDLSAVVPAP